jgi:hypothetical protein
MVEEQHDTNRVKNEALEVMENVLAITGVISLTITNGHLD